MPFAFDQLGECRRVGVGHVVLEPGAVDDETSTPYGRLRREGVDALTEDDRVALPPASAASSLAAAKPTSVVFGNLPWSALR